MASLLCSFCCASAVSTSSSPRASFFAKHLIRPAATRASPTFSSSPLLPIVRASAEGLPTEVLEDSKFAPLNDDHPAYGPPAMMLMGLSHLEILKVQELLHNMQGDFLKVLIYTDDMLEGTLWNAMNSSQPKPSEVKGAKGVPRICFLSGLTGEELLMFVRAYQDSKMEPVAFAAMVPNNAQKPIQQLIEEVLDDHNRLTKGI